MLGRIIVSFLLTFLVNQGANAQSHDFVSQLIDDAIIKAAEPIEKVRYAQFCNLVRSHFELNHMAEFVAHKYWTKAQLSDKQSFLQTVYPSYIVSQFIGPFEDFAASKDDITIVVDSNPVPVPSIPAEQVKVSVYDQDGLWSELFFYITKTSQEYAVVDIQLMDVSLREIHKGEFKSILQNGGLTDLNKKMTALLARQNKLCP